MGGKENPVTLSSHDCHANKVEDIAWDQKTVRHGSPVNGYWTIQIMKDGNETVPQGRAVPNGKPESEGKALNIRTATLRIRDQTWHKTVNAH